MIIRIETNIYASREEATLNELFNLFGSKYIDKILRQNKKFTVIYTYLTMVGCYYKIVYCDKLPNKSKKAINTILFLTEDFQSVVKERFTTFVLK